MKKHFLACATVMAILPFHAFANNVSDSSSADIDTAKQCYDSCMPEKAISGPASSLSDYLDNHKFCKDKCAIQPTEASAKAPTADNG